MPIFFPTQQRDHSVTCRLRTVNKFPRLLNVPKISELAIMHYKTISQREHSIDRSIIFTSHRNHPILIHIFVLYCFIMYCVLL